MERFGDTDQPAIAEQVAKALVNKGVRLGALDRSEEAVEVYDEMVERFGDTDEQRMLQILETAGRRRNAVVDN